ncbi:MAG: hypothetical protein V4467_04295 [Patescibacteria group bacterium]
MRKTLRSWKKRNERRVDLIVRQSNGETLSKVEITELKNLNAEAEARATKLRGLNLADLRRRMRKAAIPLPSRKSVARSLPKSKWPFVRQSHADDYWGLPNNT